MTDTVLTRAEKIEAIRRVPADLTMAIDGLTEGQLATPYRDGGWNPRQIVHHIADSHANAFIRMKLILTEDHPTLKPYDQDAWANGPDYACPLDASLAIVTGIQQRMVDLLSNVKEDEWSKTAHHPDNGEMSLDNILDLYATHGAAHIAQITGLREKMGW